MMSSLFIGATGLKAHAEGMAVVTNNLANVNTVGFKQVMMTYQDLVSQTIPARSNMTTNMAQVGAGARPGEMRRLFTDGGIEKGSEATDLAISGVGFFGVQKNGEVQYTRAGNFRFTKDGDLLDPNGWNLVGNLFNNGVESPDMSPIKLNLGLDGLGGMNAKATTAFTAVSQLGGIKDSTSDLNNPFFSMVSSYDGQGKVPMPSYSYSEEIQIHDSLGNTHEALIYYDQAGTSEGRTALEYAIALKDPSQDASGLADTRGAGLLMAGTLTFAANGHLSNMTGFAPPASGDPTDLNAWSPVPLVDGVPAFTVNLKDAAPQTIAFNTGITLSGSSSAGLASAAAANANSSAIFGAASGATVHEKSSTAFGQHANSVFQENNGYTSGSLRAIDVNQEGIMTGLYSNGQSQDLARVSLFRFISQDGLRHEGNNHFSATTASGAAERGDPGEENFGRLSEYAIEQSNVDYAREFSTMIITQRGFQMNSKVVTTSDQMLQKALELKR